MAANQIGCGEGRSDDGPMARAMVVPWYESRGRDGGHVSEGGGDARAEGVVPWCPDHMVFHVKIKKLL